MRATLTPQPLHSCTIAIPASKSLSHRALIAAALADGTSVISSLVDNNDTRATIACLEHLGASFEQDGNTWKVRGIGGKPQYDGAVLDCGESGSTLRFLIPVFAVQSEESVFTGHGRLMERPQSVYETLFQEEGLSFEKEGSLLRVQGKLHAIETQIRGDVSSQFISGLLFALPLCKEDSLLHITEPYESRSYVGLTIDALHKAGIVIEEKGNDLLIPGNQNYHAFTSSIEGDESQGAFWGVLSAISHVSLAAGNTAEHSRQGDRVYRDVLERCGCGSIRQENAWKFMPGELKSTKVDLADCPDLGPVLFVLATQCEGTTAFVHAGRLRIKESDRIACMEQELAKLGCDMKSSSDTVTVKGRTPVHGGVVSGHNDHRIVMALSVLACVSDSPVVIEGAEAVGKSYPGFFEDLAGTGVQVEKHAE